MLTDEYVVRVGMEVEVAQFGEPTTYTDVAERLINAGFMLGERSNWSESHTYRCTCDLGCGQVRSGDVIIPPLVSLTYDASLPRNGGEFVTSTIVLADSGLAALREPWDIITSDAIWNNTLQSRSGSPTSPSVHLHVSATSSSNRNTLSVRNASVEDIKHALAMFGPEFIALASVVDMKRGLRFRQPSRFQYDTPHHGFVHIRGHQFDSSCYIEWRLFEAAYNDWEYIESSAFLAAALTRGLVHRDVYNALMAVGYAHPVNERRLSELIQEDDTDALLGELVSRPRLEFLRDLSRNELEDDLYGREMLDGLFDKVLRLYV